MTDVSFLSFVLFMSFVSSPTAESEQSPSSVLSFDPHLPFWSLLLLVLGVLVLVGSAYRRPSGPAVLRLTALALLGLMIANPVRVLERPDRAVPRLVLVQDASASMARADADGGTRLAAAAAALDALAERLGDRYRIDRRQLGGRLAAGFASTASGDTDFAALQELLGEEEPPVAVVLASDGGDRGTVPPDGALAAAGIPVSTLALGGTAPVANAAVHLEAASATAFPGQELGLRLVVSAQGPAIGRQSELVLRSGDGRELLRRILDLEAETVIACTEPLGAEPGERRWRAGLAAVGDEASLADNVALAVVRVVDRPLRLAVVEGRPSWDTAFAVRAWRRDGQLAVQAVYRVGGERYRSAAAGAEEPLEDLLASDRLDLLVLGGAVDAMLDPALQEGLVAWVDGGGGLLLIGIREAIEGPLVACDPLLRRPGSSAAVVPRLAPAGRALALLPEDLALPAVASGRHGGLRSRSEVLLGDAEQPLVLRRRHGGGRVAAVNADGTWRWGLGPDSDAAAAARFWRQLAKALVRSGDTMLAADRPRYRVGQEAVLALAGEQPVTVETPDGTRQQLSAVAGSARLPITAPGLWTLTAGDERLTLIGESDVREVVASTRDDARLLRLAETTGGRALAAGAVADLAETLARRSDLQVAAPERRPLVLLPWWLLLFTALLVGEWWWRRRGHGAL